MPAGGGPIEPQAPAAPAPVAKTPAPVAPPAAAKPARRRRKKRAPKKRSAPENPLSEPSAAPVAPPAVPASAPPAPAEPVMLPGIPRPMPAAPKAAGAPKSKAKMKASAPAKAAAKAEPKPPAAAKAEPKPSETPAEDGLVRQIREQFDFCSQLLAQSAFGDHYDTCLCSDARQAAPYRGRRGFYASALKKAAGDGRLETSAEILDVKLDGAWATVSARWKTRPADAGREIAEKWRLEDGLWCKAP
jgi:hypothetical protein